MSSHSRIVLRGGLLADPSLRPELGEADLWIEGEKIVSSGGVPPGWDDPASPPVESIDCSGCVLLPGIVCGHGHLYSALATGMPAPAEAPTNFVEILERVWWKLDEALDERSLRASALAGAISAIKSGTTAIIDHHASPSFIDGSLDVIADALEEVGLRSVLCYEVTDRGGEARRDAGVAENERFIRSRRPLARGLVGGHASFTMGPETLDACVDVARRTGTGLHVHAAEDGADELDCVDKHGKRVIHRFRDAGALSLPKTLLVHGVCLDQEEREILAGSEVWIAHNAKSNMNNSVGYASPANLGPRVVLGTDGIGADMFAEAQHAFFRSREEGLSSDAATVLGWLRKGGELLSLLFDAPIGAFAPGAAADVTVLDSPLFTPPSAGSFPWHWMFVLSSRDVRDVLVAGRPVLRDRSLLTVDEEAVAAVAREEARRLWSLL